MSLIFDTLQKIQNEPKEGSKRLVVANRLEGSYHVLIKQRRSHLKVILASALIVGMLLFWGFNLQQPQQEKVLVERFINSNQMLDEDSSKNINPFQADEQNSLLNASIVTETDQDVLNKKSNTKLVEQVKFTEQEATTLPVQTKQVKEPQPNTATLRNDQSNTVKAVQAQEWAMPTSDAPIKTKTGEVITAAVKGNDLVKRQNEYSASQDNSKQSSNYFLEVKGLVAQIKQAMDLKDEALVETSLQRLADLAGATSVVSLRMRAYYAMKLGHFEQAQRFYRQLLLKQPDDFEAAFNSVVALAEMGHLQMAKNHLEQLKKTHPNSPQLERFDELMRNQYYLNRSE
ncbi:MAG: hypothetical protein IE936_00165 [Moraxella osloensis]|nr:hypothetical protein [Moraxella osloensis]MBD3767419.1 hypothetical protein [Gammaproteobacteria bacterium]